MNYQEIIESLIDEKIIELMMRLGCNDYIDKENYIIFKTICHNTDVDEASEKLYYYKDNKIFVCYTECGTMSIFSMLKHYYECRNIEYDWYTDVYQVILDCSNYQHSDFDTYKYKSIIKNYNSDFREKELPIYNNNVLDCFIRNYNIDWVLDGVTSTAIDKFNILFSINQNKIIIPHYNINSELVGVRGRALDPWEIENIGKYAPIKIENQWYSHPLSMNLYGLNITKDNIKKYGYCLLFEGEKSVVISEGFDRPNCAAAVCGSNFNKYAFNILLKECSPKEVIICFDKENIHKNERSYFDKLYNMCKKYNQYSNFSFIYDFDNKLSLKDSPVDKGEGVFEKLLQERIKVK